jgi:hypothetical protein
MALMFLTEKRDKSIKGRMVCNRKPTRELLSQEDEASPTAALESIMITGVIEAKEEREVMTCNIPNAFIQALLPKKDPSSDHRSARRHVSRYKPGIVRTSCGAGELKEGSVH